MTDNRPKLLITAKLLPSVMEALERNYQTYHLWEAQDPVAYVKEGGASIEGVATTGGMGLKRELMDNLPALKVIAVYGVGLDAIDLAESARRGIQISTTPDVLTDDVADQGLGLLLALSRRIVVGDRYVREGRWAAQGDMPLTMSLTGKKVGILGFGKIGQALAKRFVALGMSVSLSTPHPPKDTPYTVEPDLLSLARNVDILVIAASGGDKTRGLVNAKVLEALGSKGLVVNISRGSVINEADLVAALQAGTIAGAALDVFASEPNPAPELLSMEQVVLAPHAASGTVETRQAMGQLVIDNLAAYYAGQSLKTPVDLSGSVAGGQK